MRTSFLAFLLIISLSLPFAFLTSGVKAQVGDPKLDRKEELRLRILEKLGVKEQNKLLLKQRIEEQKASKAAQLSDIKKQNIRFYFSRMATRINTAILRLSTLIERIEARLTIIESENSDIKTGDIHKEVDNAKALLDEATAKLAAAQANIDTVLDSNDPKKAFEVIREEVKEIKGMLVEAHTILVHTIGDIKGLRVGTQKPTGTATVSAEPTEVEPTEVEPTESE